MNDLPGGGIRSNNDPALMSLKEQAKSEAMAMLRSADEFIVIVDNPKGRGVSMSACLQMLAEAEQILHNHGVNMLEEEYEEWKEDHGVS